MYFRKKNNTYAMTCHVISVPAYRVVCIVFFNFDISSDKCFLFFYLFLPFFDNSRRFKRQNSGFGVYAFSREI